MRLNNYEGSEVTNWTSIRAMICYQLASVLACPTNLHCNLWVSGGGKEDS